MDLQQLTINTIKFLSADAIEKAKSGHPGLPFGAAPMAYTLWANHLAITAKHPKWPNRDRFVLSAGHGSSMLYALLPLFGYDLSIEDLKAFRQLDSKTPGHPEYGIVPGVETTTGPLGQGIANAVGFALAENHLAAIFNREGFPIYDHYTYVLCGDGCLMEGVSSEAASLAGTMGLGKLIVLYDSNNISIEGDTETAFGENVRMRFDAYGWQTLLVEDGRDVAAIDAAITAAKADLNRPTLIEIKTKIGAGAPTKEGKASAHGEPLGAEELAGAKKAAGWTYEESFYVPQEVRDFLAGILEEKEKTEQAWEAMFAQYRQAYPELAKQWDSYHSDELPVDLLNNEDFWHVEGKLATRSPSEKVLQMLSPLVPNLMGGSADLGPSNKSVMKDRAYYSSKTPEGSNVHFGVREFAMTAIASGLALHGGLRPYIAGFFVFSDYMKAGLRMQAIMEAPVISILTHDSIGVGEDGPTHQPVEHLAALRSMPGYTVIRPCDGHETAAAWYLALTRKGPTALVLSRQNLETLPTTGKGALKGGYIVKDTDGKPDVILIATGSEVQLAMAGSDLLAEQGIKARVVSMPSMEVFEEQDAVYRLSVLPDDVRARVAVEAASSFGWHKYVGLDGAVLSMDQFGASAPADQLMKKFGFTAQAVAEKALSVLHR